MRGGTVNRYLLASGSSVLTIVGRDFKVNGQPVPYGDLTGQTGTLTGTLASGDPINNVFYQGGWTGDPCSVLNPCTGTLTLVLQTLPEDDFEYSGVPDPQKWVVNHPECASPDCTMWSEGRTHFPNPHPWLPDSTFPIVTDGSLFIKHHLYNPYDLADPNIWFLGGEVHTVDMFGPNRSYIFEANVKWNVEPPYAPYPRGLVNSFFLYGYDESNADSDEIDFEFLSNLILDPPSPPPPPDGQWIYTNTYNDSQEDPLKVFVPGLNLYEWNTFRIHWDPTAAPRRIEWWWFDPDKGWTLLRRVTGGRVPDEPMALYFNFWAPCYEPKEGRPPQPWTCDEGWWEEAADLNLQPVNDLSANEIYAFQIDDVEIVPEPSIVVLRATALAALLVLGRRFH